MKKLFTLFVFSLLSMLYAVAQDSSTFQFVDKSGNAVADGTSLTVSELTEDEIMGNFITTGLSVKNTSGANASVRITYQIETLDNGRFQICFPSSCITKTTTGSFETNKGDMAAGDVRDLQCEWFPEAYGNCKVTLAMEVLNALGTKVANGPAVQVTFAYHNPDAKQGWWGYVDNDSEKSGLGVTKPDTYHCAIFIPGNHAVAGGKTIQAIRFGLLSSNATDAKVWIASQLPGSMSDCIQVVDVPQSELGNSNIDVALTSPYAIPAEGVYVGYTFTITQVTYQEDAYPVLITGTDAPNTLILRTDNDVSDWTDFNGNNFGRLFLQVLLEGDFPDNLVTPLDFGSVYALVGERVDAEVILTNDGITPISSIDYTITTDGAASSEQHVDVDSPIDFSSKGKVVIPIPAETTQSIKDKMLTITKVNGHANEAADKTASFTMYSLDEIISRNALVEQFTGTGCGWCPRGHVGMAKMREAFGDRFVGVALHQYSGQSSDAMNIASNKYAKLSFGGAPSARINRGEVVDPYYGLSYDILQDMEAALAIPAMADVEVSGSFDETNTKVDAKAHLRPLFDGTYKLEFVLIADGLKGTGTGWNQTNYYSSAYASQTGITKNALPDDLKYLYDLGATFNPTFNDVAIASSYVSGSNKVPSQSLVSGETTEVSYTLNLPTYTKLKNALQMDQIYVIAILIGSDGSVANVAKVKVTDYEPTDVSGVHTNTAAEATRYTLDGRQVSAPQRGLNIIRLSDGTVRKVMVK